MSEALFVIRVVLLLIVMFYVLLMCKCALPPGVNPIAVDKYISININIATPPVCIQEVDMESLNWFLNVT
jgi:hypothetical protein